MRAYVVGNPSSRGFAAKFSGQTDPPALPSAENEAITVAQVLGQHGYQVVPAIGADQEALEILTRLYQHPYRILHIAAHGIFDQAWSAARPSGPRAGGHPKHRG